jgi:hypothetical protein
MATTRQERAERIAEHVRLNPPFHLLAAPPPGYPQLPGYERPQRPTAEEIARWYLKKAEFRALKLGTWLGTEEGEVITWAIEQCLPLGYREDAELLVDALELAAAAQQKEDRKAAGILVVGAIALVGLLARDIGSAAKLRPAI